MFQTIYFHSVLQNTNPEKGYFEKPKQGMPKNYTSNSLVLEYYDDCSVTKSLLKQFLHASLNNLFLLGFY